MTISALPDAPSPGDSTAEFNSKAFSWAASLENFVTEANMLASGVNNDAATAASAASTATDKASEAVASAAAAAAASGATLWISGTSYTIGDVVYSPISLQTYRRKVSGGGVTDPSLDSTNWRQISSNVSTISGLLKGDGNGTVSAAVAGTDYVAPSGALGTPSSGTLSNCTVDGVNPIGYRNIPQVRKSAAYTLVVDDAGKHILHPSADTTARTFTIPANSSVAYPVGTAITFVNQNGAGALIIAISSDTMRLAGNGTTGSRMLSDNGVATAIKIATTEWIISGTNLT